MNKRFGRAPPKQLAEARIDDVEMLRLNNVTHGSSLVWRVRPANT
jgi:hypothetical protein